MTEEEMKAAITAKVVEAYEKLNKELSTNLNVLPIYFDLAGTTGGYYHHNHRTKGVRQQSRGRCFQFNLIMALQQPEEFLRETPGHEVAHDFQYRYFGRMQSRRLKSHGREWQHCMNLLGLPADRCHHHDTLAAEIASGRPREFAYTCENGHSFQLTKIIHNKILRGQFRICNHCRTQLRFSHRIDIEKIAAESGINLPEKSKGPFKPGSKQEGVYLLVKENMNMNRWSLISKVVQKFGMTENGAATYIYNAKKIIQQEAA